MAAVLQYMSVTMFSGFAGVAKSGELARTNGKNDAAPESGVERCTYTARRNALLIPAIHGARLQKRWQRRYVR